MDTTHRAGFNRGSADRLASRPYDSSVPFNFASSADERMRFRKGYRKGYERNESMTGAGFGEDTPVNLTTNTATTTTKPLSSPFMLAPSGIRLLSPSLATKKAPPKRSKYDGLRAQGGDRGGPLGGGGGSDAPPADQPPKTPPADQPPKTPPAADKLPSTEAPPVEPIAPQTPPPQVSSDPAQPEDTSDFGAYVKRLQQGLRVARSMLEAVDVPESPIDGRYAGATVDAVKALQEKFGLSVTPVVDKPFVAKLNAQIRARNERVAKASAHGGGAAFMVEEVPDPPSPWPPAMTSLVVRSASISTPTRTAEESKEPLKQNEPSWFQKNWYWLAIGGVVLAGGGFAASRLLAKKEAPGGQAR